MVDLKNTLKNQSYCSKTCTQNIIYYIEVEIYNAIEI